MTDAPEIPGRFIEAAGRRTFVIEAGDGPPLVLLHGASAGLDAWLTWYPTIERLSDRFRCVTFDQPGFGRTAMPDCYWNRLARTPHAIAVLDALGVRGATLVGHSEGGFMAARIAIERPDLAGRLVIVTSGGTSPALGGAADTAWIAASNSAYDHARQTRDEEAFVEAWRGLCRAWDSRLEALLRANYRQAAASGNLELLCQLPEGEKDPYAYVALQETWLFPHFPSLRLPIDLIWAAGDATVPVARGLALRERLPGARLHLLAEAGHMVMHDRAEAFAALLM